MVEVDRAARGREQCASGDGLPPPGEHRLRLSFDQEERVDVTVLTVKGLDQVRSPHAERANVRQYFGPI